MLCICHGDLLAVGILCYTSVTRQRQLLFTIAVMFLFHLCEDWFATNRSWLLSTAASEYHASSGDHTSEAREAPCYFSLSHILARPHQIAIIAHSHFHPLADIRLALALSPARHTRLQGPENSWKKEGESFVNFHVSMLD
jgi:hypothetical protein